MIEQSSCIDDKILFANFLSFRKECNCVVASKTCNLALIIMHAFTVSILSSKYVYANLKPHSKCLHLWEQDPRLCDCPCISEREREREYFSKDFAGSDERKTRILIPECENYKKLATNTNTKSSFELKKIHKYYNDTLVQSTPLTVYLES